ncbi:phage major capsid protein [Alloyangia pacifica]|uniref:Phage major capsid protein n=1 Tax=Alloyangia pacifica TaxID=311180 RepID=A0A2U8HHC5_9RHOB|nr:phage major capsid protein [Alloyangia pacifica]AWI85162.1 phage major capsid protein [Alloyangia pacifica]
MTKHFTPAPKARGIVMVRADASNPTQVLADMKRAFEEFKAEREAEIADLKKGQQDVVRSEKIDKINTEISALQTSLDEANSTLAALRTGGNGGAGVDPDVAAHSTAFNSWFRRGERAIDANLHDLEVKAALTTESDPDGGYLVPEEMSTEIDRVVGTISAMRELATVMSIGTDTYKKLVSMGGAGSGWVGEKEKRDETGTPTLRELIFNTQELYANPAATQKALDDSRLDIAQWLANEVSTEFAEQEGLAFISGDGVNKPRGVMAYDTVANASYAWGKIGFVASGNAGGFAAPTSSVSPADCLIDLYYALKQQYRNGASWLMSDATMGKVRKFKDAEGNFIWAPPAGTADVPTILGKPVSTDDNMDAVAANKFPISFGNFKRGYLIIDRFGIRVLRDPYTNKPYVHFYTTKRVGGGVQNFEAIKHLKIST